VVDDEDALRGFAVFDLQAQPIGEGGLDGWELVVVRFAGAGGPLEREVVERKGKNRNPTPRMRSGRTAFAIAGNHCRRCRWRMVRMSAQIPKQAQVNIKRGIPAITKSKPNPIGVALKAIRSRGSAMATHSGQSVFIGDSFAAPMARPEILNAK